MPLFDDDAGPKLPPHRLGEDLSKLSEDEICERLSLLRAEMDRLEAALAAKRESRRAAGSFFRTPPE